MHVMRRLVFGRRIAGIAVGVTILGCALALAPSALAQTGLTCSGFATDPAGGLVGNPAVTNVTAVEKVTTPDEAGVTPGTPYCQVDLTWSTPGMSGPAFGYAEGEAQQIKMEFTFPTPANWTRRIVMTSAGGAQGDIPAQNTNFQNLWHMLEWGAVGGATDSGHEGRGNFGVIQSTHTLDTGKIEDWVGRANGIAIKLVKQLVKRYYGSPVRYTYWEGQSGGGHMGWAQITKYPNEYDGVLIGAPAAQWQQFRLSDSWRALVQKKVAQQTTPLTQAQLDAATAGAVAACDGDDGVVDGIIAEPRACTWSARHNVCGVAGAPAAPDCVNVIQADGIDKMWDGPRNKYGLRIWNPYERGVPLRAGTDIPGSTRQVMQWNHADLDYEANENLYLDQESINLARAAGADVSDATTYAQEAALTSQTTAELTSGWTRDISEARTHGMKIMVYHGTLDGAINMRNDIERYRQNATFFSRGHSDPFASLQSWYRYYIVPGLPHSAEPWMPQLMDWVEDGVAPDKIVQSDSSVGGSIHPSSFPVVCPFPQKAIFDGSGPITDPANYSCGGNLEANPVALCTELMTAFGFEDKPVPNTPVTDIPARGCWHPRGHGHGHHHGHGHGHGHGRGHDHRHGHGHDHRHGRR